MRQMIKIYLDINQRDYKTPSKNLPATMKTAFIHCTNNTCGDKLLLNLKIF